MVILDKKGHLCSTSSLDELHLFASKLGMKREWFQDKRIPHYDLITERMKRKAVKLGARLVSSKTIVKNSIRRVTNKES